MPQLSLFELAPKSAVATPPTQPSHPPRAHARRQATSDSATDPPAESPALLALSSARDGPGNADRPRHALPSPAASIEYVAYIPIAAGDSIAQTVVIALASFRERRGTEPAHVAVHPDDVAALTGMLAIPVLGQSACPRGHVRLALG